MKSYDLFDLFAAWFTWMAKPRRFLTEKLQEAGWTVEHTLQEKKKEKEGKRRGVPHARCMSYTEYRTEW